MAITTKVILQQVEVQYETGLVLAQLKKQILNGDTVMLDETHRISIPPDVQDVDSMFAVYDVALQAAGFPAVGTAQWDRVRAGLGLVANERAMAFAAAELARAAAAQPAP